MTTRPSSLLAVYDYAVAPPTFDYFNFLVLAEAHRRRAELDDIHLIFMPDDKGGFFPGMPLDDLEKTWRLHNILIPGAALMPSCRQVTICAGRRQGRDIVARHEHVFPPRYAENGPVGLFEAAELMAAWARGYEIPSLVATEPARRYVRDYLASHARGRRAVTITLRQASYSSFRNSNVAAWTCFAAGLDPARYFPIFLPDMETLFRPRETELAEFAVFGEATANLSIRSALYELAFVNLMKAGGPGQMAFLHHAAPTILFSQANSDSIDSSGDAIRSSAGIDPGQQFPYLQDRQKIAWREDNAENIAAEFAAFEAFVEERIDISSFKPLSKPSPRDVAGLLARSWKPTQAQEILEHLLAEGGFDPELAFDAVKLQNERGFHAAALERIRDIVAHGHTNAGLDEQSGDALAGLVRRPEAIEAYERALAAGEIEDNMRVRVAIKLGFLLAESGDIDRAERCAKDALSGSAHDRLLLQFLAELWSTRGQPERARYYAEREIEMLRDRPASGSSSGEIDETALRLGALYVSTGRYEEAHAHLSGVVARAPMNWAANEALADALAGLGRFGDAIGYLEAAIGYSWERRPSPLLKLARLRSAGGELDKAERAIRRCIELAPDHGPSYELLADILMRQNRPREALQALVRARELEAR